MLTKYKYLTKVSLSKGFLLCIVACPEYFPPNSWKRVIMLCDNINAQTYKQYMLIKKYKYMCKQKKTERQWTVLHCLVL